MPTTLYLVQVLDTRHDAQVMTAITVAVSPREAARRVCAARFGKWTDADRVRVRQLCGPANEDYPFESVAPED